ELHPFTSVGAHDREQCDHSGNAAQIRRRGDRGKPMNQTTRRGFIQRAAAAAGGIGTATLFNGIAALAASPKKSDVRIDHVAYRYEEHTFRTPLKFARTIVDRQTHVTVECTVRTAAGQVATGLGTLPFNYTFSFPSKRLSPDARLRAMQALAEQIAKI